MAWTVKIDLTVLGDGEVKKSETLCHWFDMSRAEANQFTMDSVKAVYDVADKYREAAAQEEKDTSALVRPAGK